MHVRQQHVQVAFAHHQDTPELLFAISESLHTLLWIYYCFLGDNERPMKLKQASTHFWSQTVDSPGAPLLCLQPADSAIRYDNYTTGVIGGLLRCCGADMLVAREMFRQINNVNKQQQKLMLLDNAS